MKFPHTALQFATVLSSGVVFSLVACSPHGGSTVATTASTLPSAEALESLPLGDLAGAAKLRAAQEIPNPLAGDATAIAEGHKLFVSMNCAGCHGYDAGGGMGPNLTDSFWRYGGTPASVYKSIYEGRPQGMPAWGRALPPQELWKLVSYIQTLGGAIAAQRYHAGLQGDHDVSSVVPELQSLSGAFDRPSAAPAIMGGEDSSMTPAPVSPRTP